MKNSNSPLYFMLALILPISGFICASLNPKMQSYRTLLVLFFTFVGIAFLFTSGGDVSRYVDEFILITTKKMSLIDYYNSQPAAQQIDYYNIFMTWFLSRLTSNPHVYLGILAFVPTVFLTQNVLYISEKCSDSSRYRFLLFILVLTPNVLFLTHRWWTALQIFLFGMLPYILMNKTKRLWICLLAVGVHFSFLFPLMLLLLYMFLPKRALFPYLLVFVATYFVSILNFDFVSNVINQILPTNYADRSVAYLSNKDDILQGWAFNSLFRLHNLLNLIFAIFIFFRLKVELKCNDFLRHLLIISLIMASFAQLTNMTDWGWRYFDLSNFLFTSLLVIIVANHQLYKKLKILFRLSYPFFCFFLVMFVHHLFAVISLTSLLVGNYFTIWFIDEEVSVLEYIKNVL